MERIINLMRKPLLILLASLAVMQFAACNNATSVPEATSGADATGESATISETTDIGKGTDNTSSTVTHNGGYVLDMGGKGLTIPVSDEWDVTGTGALIQCEPIEYEGTLVAKYSDSLINVGDEEKLQELRKQIEKEEDKEGVFGTMTFDDGEGYILAIETMYYNRTCIFEPVQGYDTYLFIDIEELSGEMDTNELADMFVLSPYTDINAHYDYLSEPRETTTETMAYIEGKGYEINVNNKMYTMPVPQEWVQKTSKKHVISCQLPDTEEPVFIQYMCSWVNIGDNEEMDKALKYNFMGYEELIRMPIDTPTGEGIMVIFKDDTAVVYQPVEDAGMYMEVDIVSGSRDKTLTDIAKECLFDITPVQE